jgi:Carbonic anhydrase
MASQNITDVLAGNEKFVETFKDGDKPLPPARKLAIVTCMDARLHPEKFLGLEIGDAHVIRNAGGRVSDDAIRWEATSDVLLDFCLLPCCSPFFGYRYSGAGNNKVSIAVMSRSLAISERLLGTKEIIVIHHTDCGMETFENADIRQVCLLNCDTCCRKCMALTSGYTTRTHSTALFISKVVGLLIDRSSKRIWATRLMQSLPRRTSCLSKA